jgi:hypothetical protein
VTALDSMLSCDGKVWLWENAELWSGTLEHTPTEDEIARDARVAKTVAINKRFDARIAAAEKKYARLYAEREKAFDNV